METLYRVIDRIYAETVERAIDIVLGLHHDPVRELMVRPVMVPQHPPMRTVTVPNIVLAATSEQKSEPHAPPPGTLPIADEPLTFQSLGTLIQNREHKTTHVVAYTMSTGVPMHGNPTKEYDSVRMRLPYGALVLVLGESGRFCLIAYGTVEGWVLRDELAYRSEEVFPELMVGTAYTHDDPQTLRLRACIEDQFAGAEAEIPLQAGEYVTYRLLRRGTRIPWDATRPRVPGRWHMLLKGKQGVHVGVVPTTGCLVECTLEHDMGHIAYVDHVDADERITISEANYPSDGMYNERTLTKEEWKELRPVFIDVRE